MKVGAVLVIVILALVECSKTSDDTEVTTQSEHHVTHSNSLHKHRMPFFPKNSHRFTMTIKSINPRRNSSYPSKLSQSPTKFKIIPTAIKIRNANYWKTAPTRRPLMKHIQFTTNRSSTLKIPVSLKIKMRETGRKYKSIQFNKMINANGNNSSSEEISESSNEKKQSKEKYFRATISPLILRSKTHSTKQLDDNSKSKEADSELPTDVTTKSKKVSESDFSSEEKEDREEFIFVKPKTEQSVGNMMSDDSDESDETATVIDEEIKIRHKRSINIIEEENLATTVSGFKFTGKIAPLSNDLMFRNINT